MAKGATSLKDLKDKITAVRATELERRIGTTIMDSYRDVAKGMFLPAFKEDPEETKAPVHNIAMPTLQYFCDYATGLREKLINLYNSKMNSVPGFENIPDSVKVAQGALLDGLCYVYNMQTGGVTVATMNLDILYDLNVETNMQKQIMSKNLEGVCKAYRIDIEYINGDQEFYFKAVNARNYDIDEPKKDTDPTKNFVLVPYTAGIQLMKICENYLDRGAVLRVRQVLSGTVKLRFLTKNTNVLKAFCDSAEAVHGINPSFFPLKSYFYAPVVGASSLTSMVSRVNLFDIDSVSLATGKQLKNSDIRKVKNPVRDLFGERFFIARMMKLKEENPDEFKSIVSQLSRQGTLVKDADNISEADLSSYLHSVTPTAVEKAYYLADVEGKIDHVMRYLSGGIRPMTAKEMGNIEETLANEVCKFTIRKKDCSLGSVLGTNNKSMLVAVYGDDLIRYESFSARFYKLSSDLREFRNRVLSGDDYSVGSKAWKALVQAYVDYLIPFDMEVYNKLVEACGECSEAVFINKAKAYAAESAGVDLKRSEAASKAAETGRNNGTIQCKSLTAHIDENGKSVDFYKTLDKSKVVSAWVLESK